MTPEEERAEILAMSERIDEDLRDRFNEIMLLILGGMAVKAAVQEVIGDIEADMAEAIANGLTAVTGETVTAAEVLQMNVGSMRLSPRLYQEVDEVSTIAAGIVERHEKGFQQARDLALALFVGYVFSGSKADPVEISTSNPKLPKYMREVLATEAGVERAIAAKFAQMQIDGLKSAALRNAYNDVLTAIDGAANGVGSRALKKRIEVAWFVRLRYFAQRIAQTEAHRAYMKRLAQSIMDNKRVLFIQVSRASINSPPCICDAMTGRDKYGIGVGVYPKELAPLPPYHPACLCWWKIRKDIDGTPIVERQSDAYFLSRLKQPIAARIAGSYAKLKRIQRGERIEDVFNESRDPRYHIATLG